MFRIERAGLIIEVTMKLWQIRMGVADVIANYLRMRYS